jgi:hypothetical protein
MRWSPLVLIACASDPAALPVDAAPPPAPLQLAWDGPSLSDELPSTAEVTGWPTGVAGTVVLVGSRAQQVPPVCFGPGSACREVATPYVEVGRDTIAPSEAVTTFTFEPADYGWQAGDSVVLQALLLGADGRAWASSNPLVTFVDGRRPGCTYPLSPDYDPFAELDTGCACPERVVATTQAQLDAYAECAELGRLDLRGWTDPTLSLPKLERAQLVMIRDAAPLTAVHLPRLARVDDRAGFSTGNTPALRTVDLPALEHGGVSFANAPNLDAVELPALVAGEVTVARTGAAAVRLPAFKTGDLRIEDNPGLAAVEAAALAYSRTVVIRFNSLTTPLSLPSLGRADSLVVDNDPAITGLYAPRLRSVGYFSTYDVPALTDLALPALETADDVVIVRADALPALSLPALRTLGALELYDNLTLATLDLPALTDSDWSANFDDNPALCVTATPLFAAPPPGCTAVGDGNLCDP